jgi:hypothetical protein
VVILFKDLGKELLVKCSRAFVCFFWRVTLKKILTSHLSLLHSLKDKHLQRRMAMPAIDKILEVLTNGNWHKLSEVAQKVGTQESKIELISSFLSAYDFLQYDKKTKKVKLSSELQEFFEKIREVEQRVVEKRKRSS